MYGCFNRFVVKKKKVFNTKTELEVTVLNLVMVVATLSRGTSGDLPVVYLHIILYTYLIVSLYMYFIMFYNNVEYYIYN